MVKGEGSKLRSQRSWELNIEQRVKRIWRLCQASPPSSSLLLSPPCFLLALHSFPAVLYFERHVLQTGTVSFQFMTCWYSRLTVHHSRAFCVSPISRYMDGPGQPRQTSPQWTPRPLQPSPWNTPQVSPLETGPPDLIPDIPHIPPLYLSTVARPMQEPNEYVLSCGRDSIVSARA